MKKGIILVLIILTAGGCTKLKYLDELLTLKSLADSQGEMADYVEVKDRKFNFMLDEAAAGRIEKYSNKTKVLRTFSDPIFVKTVSDHQDALEVWLYRYSTDFFGSQKIYLYFDKDENLVNWKYDEGDYGKIK